MFETLKTIFAIIGASAVILFFVALILAAIVGPKMGWHHGRRWRP